jgi:hypothetical protein
VPEYSQVFPHFESSTLEQLKQFSALPRTENKIQNKINKSEKISQDKVFCLSPVLYFKGQGSVCLGAKIAEDVSNSEPLD